MGTGFINSLKIQSLQRQQPVINSYPIRIAKVRRARLPARAPIMPNCVMDWTLQKFDQDGRLIAATAHDGRGLPAP